MFDKDKMAKLEEARILTFHQAVSAAKMVGRAEGMFFAVGLGVAGVIGYSLMASDDQDPSTAVDPVFIEGFDSGAEFAVSAMQSGSDGCWGDDYSGARDFLLDADERGDYRTGCERLERALVAAHSDMDALTSDVRTGVVTVQGGRRSGEVFALETAYDAITDRVNAECPRWLDDSGVGCFYFVCHAMDAASEISDRMGDYDPD